MVSIREIFKRGKRKSVSITPNEFAVGMILKMNVASRSHVSEPYYVEVIYYTTLSIHGKVKMITSIPGEHKLEMTVGSNWEYHYPRMEIIGHKSTYGHLLYNQKLK